jgi:hypothetical protein
MNARFGRLYIAPGFAGGCRREECFCHSRESGNPVFVIARPLPAYGGIGRSNLISSRNAFSHTNLPPKTLKPGRNLIIFGFVIKFERVYFWLFDTPKALPSWWRVIIWWEIRRIPYNLVVAVYGLLCLIIFFWAITSSGHLQPGEDAVEPMALIVAPFVVNICYTLGWLAELAARLVIPSLSTRFSPILLKIGIGFSLLVISIPAMFWLGYHLLQAIGTLR